MCGCAWRRSSLCHHSVPIISGPCFRRHCCCCIPESSRIFYRCRVACGHYDMQYYACFQPYSPTTGPAASTSPPSATTSTPSSSAQPSAPPLQPPVFAYTSAACLTKSGPANLNLPPSPPQPPPSHSLHQTACLSTTWVRMPPLPAFATRPPADRLLICRSEFKSSASSGVFHREDAAQVHYKLTFCHARHLTLRSDPHASLNELGALLSLPALTPVATPIGTPSHSFPAFL